MRTIVCILMCLGMASVVSAVSITNGDFEALGVRNNVPDWFDGPDVYLRLRYSPNGTQYMGFRYDGNWAYQSIGSNTGGVSALQIQYEIGCLDLENSPNNTNPPSAASELIMTVSLYESDGSFEGADGTDIDGADGATLIDSVEVSYPAMDPGVFTTGSIFLQYVNMTSGELFLRFENVSGDEDNIDYRFSIDNVQIGDQVPSVVSRLPKDGTEFVAVELDSSENDLVFSIADDDITEVDVLFVAEDPNLLEKIADISVSSGNQYTVDLEGLAEDLDFSTEHFWQVLAYEPNGVGPVTLKYESPIWSYTTIQEGPIVYDVTPGEQGAHPGEDAVFSVEHVQADTFQWYWHQNPGDPNVPLSESDPNYSGTTTDTLTVHDVQDGNAGFYGCVVTHAEFTDETSHYGELWLKKLMSYYPFETVNGGFTPDVISGKDMELKYGASLSDVNSLDGSYHLWLDNPNNQYAVITDNTVAYYEDITISFWCYATTLVNENEEDRWARVFDFGQGTTYTMFTMLYRQDDDRQGGNDVARCQQQWYEGSDRFQPELDVETAEIAPGRWYFVAITIEADDDDDAADDGLTDASGRIYWNGEHGTEAQSAQRLNVAKMTDIINPEHSFTRHFLGKNNESAVNGFFNGRIDEFKIYNYARTSEEIAQDYRAYKGDVDLCDYENYDLWDYDYDSNCAVDLGDFAVIAGKWLEDYLVFPD